MSSEVWAAVISGGFAVVAAFVGVWFARHRQGGEAPQPSSGQVIEASEDRERARETALHPLVDLLSETFYRSAEIEWQARFAGLDMSQVNLSGTAHQVWSSVLLEAHLDGKVADLVAVAEKEAPALAPALRPALRAYHRRSRGIGA